MPVKLRSNSNITFKCAYHVVWTPKYRRPVLIDGVNDRLKEIIIEVVDEFGGWLNEMEVMPDYVHLLLEVDPQFGVHKFIKRIKGRSSKILRDEFPHLKTRIPTLWTNAYFISTVGGTPVEVMKKYVQDQKSV